MPATGVGGDTTAHCAPAATTAPSSSSKRKFLADPESAQVDASAGERNEGDEWSGDDAAVGVSGMGIDARLLMPGRSCSMAPRGGR